MTSQEHFAAALVANADVWAAAHAGTETPITLRNGVRALYCYNPAQNRHAYVNIDTDIEMTTEEYLAAMWD